MKNKTLSGLPVDSISIADHTLVIAVCDTHVCYFLLV